MNNIKNLTAVSFTVLSIATTTSPAAVISNALNGTAVGNGLFGAFASQAAHVTTSITNGGGTTGTVTTTLTSLNSVAGLGNSFPSNNFAVDTSGGANDGFGWAEWTFQAVDATVGMDVSYLVRAETWFWDDSSGSIVAERGRGNGGRIGNWANGLRDDISSTGFADPNDYEFVRMTVSLVSSDGATPHSLDGITSVQIGNVAGIRVDDLNGGGTLGSSTVDSVLAFSSPSIGFDYVAIAGNGTNFENRMEGFTASFTAVPEPSSALLLALGGAFVLRRRRL